MIFILLLIIASVNLDYVASEDSPADTWATVGYYVAAAYTIAAIVVFVNGFRRGVKREAG